MEDVDSDHVLPKFYQLQYEVLTKLLTSDVSRLSKSIVAAALAGKPGPVRVHNGAVALPSEDLDIEGEPKTDEHRNARETARWLAFRLLDMAHEPISRSAHDEAASAVQLDLHTAIKQHEFSCCLPTSIVYLSTDISGGTSTLWQLCSCLEQARCVMSVYAR